MTLKTNNSEFEYQTELCKLQDIIKINDITPEKLYRYVTWHGRFIPEYYGEIIENDKILNNFFVQYNISFKDYNNDDEYHDESEWSGSLIYKFTINSFDIYIRSNYDHDSYDDKIDYLNDHNKFTTPLEFVEKTEKVVIKYQEDEARTLKYKIRNNLETFLKDKNIICIISSESLLWKWENQGCKILQWPELNITNHKIRNELKNWKVFIYTKETKDECFGVRPLSDTHDCVLIPSKYENLTNMAIGSSSELP